MDLNDNKVSHPSGDTKYESHPIFKDLERYEEFYEYLIYYISSVALFGVNPRISLNVDMLQNLKGTLLSFRFLLQSRLLNDVNALLRKFHEVACFHIYLLLYLSHETNKNFLNGSLELFIPKVQKWIEEDTKLKGFAERLVYIQNSPELSAVYALLDYDRRYKSIKKRANAHMHLSSWYHSFINNKDLDLEGREKILDVFQKDLSDVVILHITLLFVFRPYYMVSEIYLECAEEGRSVPTDLENRAMPFVDDFFFSHILPHRKDVFDFVEKETGIKFQVPDK